MEMIIEKVIFDMQLYGMSEVSQTNYSYHIKKFEEFCNKPLEEVDENDVRTFLHYLRNRKGLGIGSVNYCHTCLKFLFQVTLDKHWNDRKIPRLKGYRTLPTVLSGEEVKVIIDAVENLKHKAILSTIYGSGLRVSEVCELKVSDIRSETMQIFVRGGKGRKDRYTVLSNSNLLLLRKYWKECGKPKDWLFPGGKEEEPITPQSVRNVLKKACEKVGMPKSITPHVFRHCFATHLLEAGTDIFTIKVLLGHSSISSTMRYLHMVRPEAFGIKSPLDTLEPEDED